MDSDEKKCPYCAETIKKAAIKCRYCSSELPQPPSPVAPNAEDTREAPSTSKSARRAAAWVLAVFIVIVVAALNFHRINGDHQQEAYAELDAWKPKADAQITLESSAYGCTYQSDFETALSHYKKAEYSAWAEITAGNESCFHQKSAPPGLTWTVLQVRGDLMQIGLKRATEYMKAPDLGKHNYWTLAAWASEPPAGPVAKKASDVIVASISKPAGRRTGLRAEPDQTLPFVGWIEAGASVTVREVANATNGTRWINVSKAGQKPRWLMPEGLDW